MSLPENCEQYEKFGYDDSLMLEPFRDKLEFLEFLDLLPPNRFLTYSQEERNLFLTSPMRWPNL